ncbi:transposase [Enterococcus cecorum]|uniref:transposase n=1 Tax=Enterococcus cecorum TaxID=44008 RepID=UPI003D35D241
MIVGLKVKCMNYSGTYYLWLKYNDYLKQYFWKKKIIWSEGYFASSIGKVSQKTIEAYIKNQG